MRRWVAIAAASAGEVADRPALWMPAALAWIASVGWIPFLAAVMRPPSVAELTFFGARLVTSGAWPWNAVLIVGAAAALVLLAFGLAAGGNAVLIALVEGRRPSGADAARLLGVSLLAALPAAVAATLLAIALAGVAPAEFNAPESGGGPVLRTLAGVAPQLVVFGLGAMTGAACAAVAGRLAVRDGSSPLAGLRATPVAVVRVGAPVVVHAVVTAVIGAGFLVVGALLLRVLWAPIGAQLGGGGGIDVASGLLLVGFVAIWLCLVFVGGALHAWSASTWSRLLAAGARQMHPRRI